MDLLGLGRVPFLARRNFFFEVRHILAWGVVVGLVEGNFASVVVAKTFGGGDLLVLIAATTPVAAHMASLLWGMFCIGRRKVRLAIFCAAGVVLFTGSVGATPVESWGAWVFVAQMAAAQFFVSGVVTVRSALWKSNYEQSIRGQVAGKLYIVRSVTRMGAVAGAAVLFDVDATVYRWVYPAAAVIGVVAIRLLGRIHVRGEASELARRHQAGQLPQTGDNLIEPFSLSAVLSPGHVLASAFRVLRVDLRFRHYCIAQALSGCGNLMIRSVVVVVLTRHLLVDMGAEYWMNGVLLELLPMLLMLVCVGRFAKYFDRVGVVRFRVLQGIGWVATSLCGMAGTIAVVYAERIGPLYVVFGVALFACFAVMRGLCFAGGTIAWNLGHLHFARPDDAEAYMGIHVSLTGLRGLIMPAIGMALWVTIGWWVWVVSAAFSVLALVAFVLLDRAEREMAGPAGASGTES